MNMYNQKCLMAAILVLTVFGGLATAEENDRSDFKRSFSRDCANSYTATCLKLDIVSWVDKLNEEDQYSVLPGVSVISEKASPQANTSALVNEIAKNFPNDADARLDAFLLKKVTGYLSSHSIRVSMFDKNSIVSARKKDKGGLGLALAAAAMMKGMLFALALGGLAALAGKALMTGLISLMLSAIIGLKSLAGGGHKSTTYEIVSKPVYSHSNTHSSSHEDVHHGGGGGGGGGAGAHAGYSAYGRSFDTPLPLSLQPGYTP